jgi:hypothetical protein
MQVIIIIIRKNRSRCKSIEQRNDEFRKGKSL